MNWLKFASILLGVGAHAIEVFVKNPNSKKLADGLLGLGAIVITGVANQNPDGTPATVAFTGPLAATADSVTATAQTVAKSVVTE